MLQLRRPLLLMGLLAVLLLVGVAGCGGDDKGGGVASLGGADSATSTTNASASGGKDIRNDLRQMLAWARCMRQHGLPNMPDPQLMGDGIAQRFPRGVGPNDPKVKAAQQACRQHQPDGGQVQRPSPQQQQEALAFARCMRQHGINLPDPQITAEGIDQPPAPGVRRDDLRAIAAEQACAQRGGGGK
jgi:hypothetical protein